MTVHGRRTVLIGSAASAVVAGSSGRAFAAPNVFVQEGYALGGYDATAYWTVKKAVMGKPPFSFPWTGGNWLFATQANRDAFAGTPWSPALAAIVRPETVRAITFGPDGSLTVIRAKSSSRDAYHLAAVVAP